jgi:hypothetical protein
MHGFMRAFLSVGNFQNKKKEFEEYGIEAHIN